MPQDSRGVSLSCASASGWTVILWSMRIWPVHSHRDRRRNVVSVVAFMTEALSMSLKDHLKEEDSKQTRTQRAIHA
jgi:hypothetical protein